MESNLLKVSPVDSLYGTFRALGDKSISHRFAMLTPLCNGQSTCNNFLTGNDCLATIGCMEKIGSTYLITGSALKTLPTPRFTDPTQALNAENSGTTMRLLCGLLSFLGISATILGDASLSKRPMERVITPLSQMGAVISACGGLPPIQIVKSKLHGMEYTLPVQSAQLKSAIMLAALGADSPTVIHQKYPIRDHTERMLAQMGVRLDICQNTTVVYPQSSFLPIDNFYIPCDISSAAYAIAGAIIIPNSDIKIKNVGINPTRMGFVNTLTKMGADISFDNIKNCFEPTADISVKYKSLTNIVVDSSEIPSLIDEIPLLALVACFAKGNMRICGAQELRHKESNRFDAIISQLSLCGGSIYCDGDDIVISGVNGLNGGHFNSLNDHRLAMTFYVAALASKKASLIENFNCVSISFPDFYKAFEEIEVKNEKI